MFFSEAIEGFKLARLADGYAQVTIRGYLSSLRRLCNFLDDPEIQTITTEQLKSFMRYLRTEYQPIRKSGDVEPLASASYHRYWKAMRSFFKWAADEKISERPDLEIKMPRYTNREIVPYSEQDIAKLLKACDRRNPAKTRNRKAYQCRRQTDMTFRDKSLLLFLLDTGIRSGECSRLKIKDVNLENGEVQIHPHHVRKTRPRTVYIGKITRKMVWRYLLLRPGKNENDYLFVTMQGRQMSQECIKAVFYDLGKNAKVANVHPHRFRHTFAIQYLRNGSDVFTLQRILGHSTLEMVRHYLAIAEADASEAHRKSSPVDRWKL